MSNRIGLVTAVSALVSAFLLSAGASQAATVHNHTYHHYHHRTHHVAMESYHHGRPADRNPARRVGGYVQSGDRKVGGNVQTGARKVGGGIQHLDRTIGGALSGHHK